MFVSNQTNFECVLARGLLTDETAVLSVNFEVRYAVADDGSLSLAAPTERLPTDPPDIRRIVLWRGTSVTAAGTAYGPSQPPYERTVSLSVDGTEHRLKVFGPRRWIRAGKELVPSPPKRFEAVPLSWELAFGGEYEQPPGVDRDSGLPHPGGRVIFPYNPKGVGFYADEQSAEGKPLPQIERADQRVESALDRPTPGGLTPCQGLPALRFDDGELSGNAQKQTPDPALVEAWRVRLGTKMLHTSVRLQHHAPAPLIVPWLHAGTPVKLDAIGVGPLSLQAPTLPVQVMVRRGRNGEPLRCRLRSLHIDGDRREALAVFGFAHRYHPATAPHWATVRSSEAS